MKQFVLTKKRYTDKEVEKIIADVAFKCDSTTNNIAIRRDFSKAAQKRGRENRFVPLNKGECW